MVAAAAGSVSINSRHERPSTIFLTKSAGVGILKCRDIKNSAALGSQMFAGSCVQPHNLAAARFALAVMRVNGVLLAENLNLTEYQQGVNGLRAAAIH